MIIVEVSVMSNLFVLVKFKSFKSAMILIVCLSACVSTSLIETMVQDIETLKTENAELKQKNDAVATAVQDVETNVENMDVSISTTTIDDSTDHTVDAVDSTPTPARPPERLDPYDLYSKAQNQFHDGQYRESA